MCIFVFPLVVILKEIVKTPYALGRFHGDFVYCCFSYGTYLLFVCVFVCVRVRMGYIYIYILLVVIYVLPS